MKTAANLIVALVAIEHIGILILEMFFWNHPVGYRIFGTTPATAETSAILAMNQGLYNGFLAAGLIWGPVSESSRRQDLLSGLHPRGGHIRRAFGEGIDTRNAGVAGLHWAYFSVSFAFRKVALDPG